jgi:hypothetical protein
MGISAKVTSKIRKATKKVGPVDTRTLYKRVVTESGGDSLIDRGVTRTVTDTAFSLQPLYNRVGKRAEILSTASRIVTPFDYEFLFIPEQMTLADVQNKNTVLVWKDSFGNEEVLELVFPDTMSFNGIEAGIRAVYRSVSR